MLPPNVLDEIEALANAATPGPWVTTSEWTVRAADDERVVTTSAYERHAADAEFVAVARSDVPLLVSEVRRLRKVLENLSQHATSEADRQTARAALEGE